MSPSSSEPDFFIGYESRLPAAYRRRLRQTLIFLGALIFLLGFILAKNQRDPGSNSFEYGELSEIVGVLIKEPVPMLLPLRDSLAANEDGFGKGLLLVGVGKQGAEPTIYDMENERGMLLDGAWVTLRGTLIYGEGIALLELTEGKEALREVKIADTVFISPPFDTLGDYTLRGEIIDPKCYFGLMKPATGKVHRSCAIRCIDGGIPPVLAAASRKGDRQFMLLRGAEGEAINHKLSYCVGDPVEVEGMLLKWGEWLLLCTDPEGGIRKMDG